MVPPFPNFIFCIVGFITAYIQLVQLVFNGRVFPPPLPFQAILAALECVIHTIEYYLLSLNILIRRHCNVNRGILNAQTQCIVWNILAENPEYFWFLTGETSESLMNVVDDLGYLVELRVRDPWHPRNRIRRTRPNTLCIYDRILMTFICLRQYLTLCSLASMFKVSASYVCENLYIIVPILHQHYVHRYLTWHDETEWNEQRGEFQEFPNAVGAIDAFSVRINRPQGRAQRLYYRRDRGFHFLNFQAIIDNDGYFQFVRGGYLGHATDADSYGRLPSMGYRQTLHLPHNSYVLADGGYPSVCPLITPFRRRRGGYLGIVQRRAYRVSSSTSTCRTQDW